MKSTRLTVKCQLDNSDLRRRTVELPASGLTLALLRSVVREMFEQSDSIALEVIYTGVGGDVIVIGSDDDAAEALRCASVSGKPTMRLHASSGVSPALTREPEPALTRESEPALTLTLTKKTEPASASTLVPATPAPEPAVQPEPEPAVQPALQPEPEPAVSVPAPRALNQISTARAMREGVLCEWMYADCPFGAAEKLIAARWSKQLHPEQITQQLVLALMFAHYSHCCCRCSVLTVRRVTITLFATVHSACCRCSLCCCRCSLCYSETVRSRLFGPI